MNNKIASVILVVGIAATGFAGISSANSGQNVTEKVSGMQQWINKAFQGKHFGKRKGGGNLTNDEKTDLEAMSDEEKKEFFEAKKEVMQAKMQESKAVIDKLIAGESLTSAEEAIRLEILATFESEDNEHSKRRGGGDIITKIIAGDEFTADEETEFIEMQAKHAQREAQNWKGGMKKGNREEGEKKWTKRW